MLEIAFIILAALIVLFGLCAFAAVRSGYEDDDTGEPEEAGEETQDEDEASENAAREARVEERRRKREKRRAEKAAAQKAEAERIAAEKAASAAEAFEKASEPRSELQSEPQSEPQGGPRNEPQGDVGATRRIELPKDMAEEPEPKDTPACDDLDKTRKVTKEELKQLRAAAAVDSAEAPEEPAVGSDYDGVRDGEDDDDDEGGINPVPFIIGGAVALAVLGGVAFGLVRGDIFKKNDGLVHEPKTVTATVSNIVQESEFMGTIKSETPDVRSFAAAGKVKSVNAAEGDHVQKGQTLYVLDSSAIEERISLLRQRLNNAKTTRETTVEDETSVKAGSSGAVTVLNFDEGDSVSSGDVIAQIANVSDYRVTLDFDAEDTGTVNNGDAADVSIGGDVVSGTVTNVKLVDEEEDEVPLYRLTISFRGGEAGAQAGATVNGAKSLGTASVAAGNRTSSTVRATATGRISDLRVEEGGSVSEGDVVAVITTSRSVTETDTDELQAKDLNLQIEQLESELANYTLKADTGGYLQKLYLKAGDNAAVNMQAAVIIPDGSLYLDVALDEKDSDLTVPAVARFTLLKTAESGVPDEAWQNVDLFAERSGIMDSVAPSAEEPDSFSGHIDIDDQTGLVEGMNAKVSVVTYSAYDALLLPKELVKDGRVTVWRAQKAEEVPVKTGITTDDGYVEIVGGITAVDKVVTGEALEDEK